MDAPFGVKKWPAQQSIALAHPKMEPSPPQHTIWSQCFALGTVSNAIEL